MFTGKRNFRYFTQNAKRVVGKFSLTGDLVFQKPQSTPAVDTEIKLGASSSSSSALKLKIDYKSKETILSASNSALKLKLDTKLHPILLSASASALKIKPSYVGRSQLSSTSNVADESSRLDTGLKLSATDTSSVTASGIESGRVTFKDIALYFHARKADGTNAGSGSLGTWSDLSNNGHNATLNGFSYTSTDGWIGTGTTIDPYSLVYDGNSKATVANNSDLIVSAFTLEAWVYPTNYPTTALRLIAKTNGTTANGGYTLALNSGTAGKLGYAYFNTWNGTTVNGIFTNSALTVNNWYHLVATYDGTTMKLYVNGTQQTETLNVSVTSNTEDLIIGAKSDNTRGIVGKLPVVRVYKRALSSDEITGNYQAGYNLAQLPSADTKIKSTISSQSQASLKTNIDIKAKPIVVSQSNSATKIAHKYPDYVKAGLILDLIAERAKDGLEKPVNVPPTTIWDDLSPYCNDATLENIEFLTQSGWFGDGSYTYPVHLETELADQRISVSSLNGLSFPQSEGTVSVGLNIKEFNQNSKIFSEPASNNHLYIVPKSGNYFEVALEKSDGTNTALIGQVEGNSFIPNEPILLTVTYKTGLNGSLKLYLNNSYISESIVSDTGFKPSDQSVFFLNNISCEIYNVRIYNRCISPDEVVENYNSKYWYFEYGTEYTVSSQIKSDSNQSAIIRPNTVGKGLVEAQSSQITKIDTVSNIYLKLGMASSSSATDQVRQNIQTKHSISSSTQKVLSGAQGYNIRVRVNSQTRAVAGTDIEWHQSARLNRFGRRNSFSGLYSDGHEPFAGNFWTEGLYD